MSKLITITGPTGKTAQVDPIAFERIWARRGWRIDRPAPEPIPAVPEVARSVTPRAARRLVRDQFDETPQTHLEQLQPSVESVDGADTSRES